MLLKQLLINCSVYTAGILQDFFFTTFMKSTMSEITKCIHI
jgi:hypothetical protein